MMRSIFCTIDYHQQDTPTFCGPAVAEMFLARPGMTTFDQRVLAKASSEIVGSNGTSLNGVRKILSTKLPAGFAGTVDGHEDTDRERAIERVVETLRTTRLPVPVLVFGRSPHWILIRGAVIDDAPQADGASSLRGFYIANPAPVTASLLVSPNPLPSFEPPPLPHGPKDRCGSGGLQGGRFAYVSAESWRLHYWPDPEPGGRTRTFVSITTSHVPSEGDVIAAPIENVTPPPTTISPVLEPIAAKAAAETALQAHGLHLCEPFKTAFDGATPAEVTEQEIVVDTTKDKWFIVTFQRRPHTVGAVFVQAATGQLMGVMAPVSAADTDETVRAWIANEVELQSNDFADIIVDDRRVTPDEIDIDPIRFWQPCFESTSPFHSFVRFGFGGSHFYALYLVRIYRTLTHTRCTPDAEPPGKPMGFIVYR